VRRRAPRPLSAALAAVAGEAAPATLLAGVQSAWRGVAGEVVAAEAEPASERDGIVTIACRSGVWAQELDLLADDLLERLNAALAGDARVRGLRFRVGRGGIP
jgi:predicted nucleic acid-binding Zn ribbon protein